MKTLRTIELRSWPFTYRGPLVIVSSASPDRTALTRFELAGVPHGVTIAIVDVVDMRPAVAADQSAALGDVLPGEYAWCLANVRALAPVSRARSARTLRRRRRARRLCRSRVMKRAALYTRVSTADQSTALQHDEAARLITARGWELASKFEDVGVSGAKGRRPGLDALLEAARKRRFDALVVWRADRLFRSVHHMVSTLADLSALGIDFVSCTEPFDTSTPTGRLLFHLCAAFAQFERDIIIERTVAGVAAARRRGKRLGRPRRYVDVERARALLATGRSQRSVAAELGVGFGTLQRALTVDPQSSAPTGSEGT